MLTVSDQPHHTNHVYRWEVKLVEVEFNLLVFFPDIVSSLTPRASSPSPPATPGRRWW